MEQLQAADEGILFWFENHHSAAGNAAMRFITHVGDARTVVCLVPLALLVLLLAGRRRTALVVLLASLVGLGISEGIKFAIHRTRPDVRWRLIDRPTSPSFPSGHSLNSMAIYGTLALVTARHLRRRAARVLVRAAGLGLPLLIGVSRPYLGVHYPSDVLAGWTAGLAVALLALWADQRWGDRERFLDSTPSDSNSASGGR